MTRTDGPIPPTTQRVEERQPLPTAGVWRALQSRNYRLFIGGQGISLIGTWIQQIALSWLVYTLTRSAFLLGLVGFSSQIGSFVLAPVAGVVADRSNKHHLLVLTQSLAMVQALVIGVLTLTHTVAVWHIVTLSLFISVVNAFDMPTRHAFYVEMIENRADLPNAIALNSSMVNGARLVGPAVAGLLIAAVGEGICFILNAASYVAVIAALLAMRIAPKPQAVEHRRIWHELREGFVYTFGFAPTRDILGLLALAGVAAMPYSTLLPIFAAQILHGGASTLGFLSGATGVGALAGATILAARRTVLGLGRWIPAACGGFGVSLIGFALSRSLALSLVMLVATGLTMITHLAASNTILQTVVEDRWRGRVMSFYSMAFVGTAPFGSLLAGSLAHRIGAPQTVILGGAVCIAAAVVFAVRLPALRRLIRPVYRQRGIIPEVATGLGAAAEGGTARQ
ncbi:MAG TPA: MFS transporter [Thermoanaerobaculaceae bacterium]|nr:MFS transporter [Thermoanaerobaculaceae bacterium]